MGAISSTQWWTRDSQPLLIFVCPSFPRTEEQRTFSGIVCWRLIFSCSQSACILTWDIQLCGKQAFAKDFFSLKQISWQKWTLLHTFMFSFLFCFSCFLNHEFCFCEFFFFFGGESLSHWLVDWYFYFTEVSWIKVFLQLTLSVNYWAGCL